MLNVKTIEKYCCEDISLIENYEIAINSEEQYECHHRKEIEENKTSKQLIAEKMYYHRPASELIFLSHSEHRSLHHKGKVVSAETRKKMSERRLGKKGWHWTSTKPRKKRRGVKPSEETKRKISATMNSERVRKRLSECWKGKHRKIVDGKWIWY